MEEYNLDTSMKVVAAITGHKDLKEYKELLDRKFNISSHAAAALLTVTIQELGNIVCMSPVFKEDSQTGESCRISLVDAIDHLHTLRTLLVDHHKATNGPAADNE